mmetsp:Transcript_6127/g.13078  ORF Transcript_6127/g.13078 Transcript_6127/m.13078 type:complete len:228 (-) Transcript_6127:466-1149(-)
MEGGVQNVRFVGAARLQDRVCVSWFTAAASRELPAELLEAKFKRLLSSDKLAEYDRLTVADREVGSIHFVTDQVCLYLAICSPQYPQRAAFQLLSEFRDVFSEQFGGDVRFVKEGELNKVSRSTLGQLCGKYEQVANVDEIESVKVQVDEVKGVMENNIHQALRNQENLDTLLDKTDVMKNEASNFQKTSVEAKNKFWWQNATYTMLIGIGLVILVVVIVLAVVLSR